MSVLVYSEEIQKLAQIASLAFDPSALDDECAEDYDQVRQLQRQKYCCLRHTPLIRPSADTGAGLFWGLARGQTLADGRKKMRKWFVLRPQSTERGL